MDKRLELFIRFNNTIRDHLQPISIAIIGMKDGMPAELSSGTCIQIGSRYFVATCEHMLRDYADNQLLLVTRNDRHTWTPIVIGRGTDATQDLGWLELPADVIADTDRTFVPLARIRPGVSHLEHDFAVLHGFPAVLAQPQLAERGIGVQPICFATGTITDPQQVAAVDPTRDIYLSYPQDELTRSDGAPTRGIEAHGISGGGIWAADANRSGLWAPDACSLIGIETSWLRFKWVRGVQVQHWLDLIRRDIPELAPQIDAVHAAPR